MTDPRNPSTRPGSDPAGGSAGVDLADSNTLAYSGRALPASIQASRVRSLGWWYQAEWRLIGMRAYWTSILGSALLTPILYVIAMGIGLGTLVDKASGGVDGVPYLTFVAPGLLVATVVMSAANETMFPVMDGFKWGKLYFARATTAASPTQVALGELLAVAIRMAAEAAVFWLVLVLLGAVNPTTSVLMIPVTALAGVAFGAPLMAYSATVEQEGYQFSMVQRFIVMPMFLFAGTFYPLSAMPGYLQWIGWISPMWHGTQLARAVSFGLPLAGWEVAVHLAFLGALAALGAWLAVRNFTRRLQR
ncbi:MAG: ABC transporter permease [Propionibacteriaceae bacterium]|nr:ABC transporter permease [Propionibacteriaceae bacterium]